MREWKRDKGIWYMGVSRGVKAGDGAAGGRRKITLALLAALVLSCWASPGARASDTPGPAWTVSESPLVRGAGDQLSPSIDGGAVFFRDESISGGGLVRYDLTSGVSTPLFGAGVSVGPDANAGSVTWQDNALNACLGTAAGDVSRCLSLPAATQMALAGTRAVTAHSNNIIRLVNFETMRSRILDSSTGSGGRYDPDIEGDHAVWVKERGYAGQYYEPLIVSYDLLTDTLTYVTKLGGGQTPAGESLWERCHPVLAGGRIMYQQRLRGAGSWDIFEAVPDSFGQPVVEASGDQTNPSLDGRFLVYQDNRAGGSPAGEWDIYLKDLVSGEEIPVSTAPGDQVNPVVRGNLIVWEDNRNGDWDLYSATITPTAPPVVAEPRLTLAVNGAFWESYAQYLAGEATVRYAISNQGPGIASDVAIRRIDVLPLAVSLSGPLPGSVVEITPSHRAMLETRFHLPAAVRWFRTFVTASCRDSAGQELWFPRPLSS